MKTINLNERNVQIIERKGFGYTPISQVYGEDISEIKEFGANHKRNKLIVKEILESWTPSSNNDTLLYFEFLRTKFEEIKVTSSEDNIIFKFPRRLIRMLPSPESVTRARRSLNSEGIGLPTDPNVIEKRKTREKAIRKYFSGDKR